MNDGQCPPPPPTSSLGCSHSLVLLYLNIYRIVPLLLPLTSIRLDETSPLLREISLDVRQCLLNLAGLTGRALGTSTAQHERGQTWKQTNRK